MYFVKYHYQSNGDESMKKLSVWTTTFAVLLAVFCVAACKGAETDETVDYTGTYKVQTATVDYNGFTATLNLDDKFNALLLSAILSEDSFTVTLNEDGTLALNLDFIVTASASGEWSVNAEDENKLDITVAGEKQTVECDGETAFISFSPFSGFTISGTMKK